MFRHAAFLAALAGALPAVGQQVRITALPFQPCCVSRDGQVIAGDLSTKPVYWTSAAGTKYVTGPNGESSISGRVWAANADGSVLAGITNVKNVESSFVFTKGKGTVIISTTSSQVYGVSDDGNSVAFKDSAGAKVWRRGKATVALAKPAGATSCYAQAISGDGTVAVGASLVNGKYISTRWLINSNTPQLLGHVGMGACSGFALRSNYDGSVIIGNDGMHGYAWTATGFIDLGICPPCGISSDGRFIVGEHPQTSAKSPAGAFLYSLGLGVVDLKSFVSSTYGTNVTKWTPELATDISADGNTIVGTGAFNNSVGWVLNLPPAPVDDFDGNKVVNANDYHTFVQCIQGQSVLPPSAADMNHDGIGNSADLARFMQYYH